MQFTQEHEEIKRTLTRFIEACGLADYDALLKWAIEEPEAFYRKLFEHIDYRFYEPFKTAVDRTEGEAWTRWCIGGTTNVVLNALDRWVGTPTETKTVLEWIGENGDRKSWTFAELNEKTCQLAAGLRRLGWQRLKMLDRACRALD